MHAGSFPYAELLLHARPQAPARLLAVDQLHVDGAGVRGRLSLLLHVTVLLACVYLIAALVCVCVCPCSRRSLVGPLLCVVVVKWLGGCSMVGWPCLGRRCIIEWRALTFACIVVFLLASCFLTI